MMTYLSYVTLKCSLDANFHMLNFKTCSILKQLRECENYFSPTPARRHDKFLWVAEKEVTSLGASFVFKLSKYMR